MSKVVVTNITNQYGKKRTWFTVAGRKLAPSASITVELTPSVEAELSYLKGKGWITVNEFKFVAEEDENPKKEDVLIEKGPEGESEEGSEDVLIEKGPEGESDEGPVDETDGKADSKKRAKKGKSSKKDDMGPVEAAGKGK